MVTQLDIARKLGISRQLVTFALAGYPQVALSSRKRIQATALEMGYCPNPHARALKKVNTGIMALWIPNQISSHYVRITHEMNRLLKQAQVDLVVSEVGATASDQVLSHVPTDGIFVVDAPAHILRYLKSHPRPNLPIISLGSHCCPKTDFVKIDIQSGAIEATRHLIQTGCRRIAHMTFVRANTNEQERRIGYLQTLAEAGLTPEFIYYPLTEFQRPIVRKLIQDYIRAHGCPEAIFCHSDDVAIAVYRGLYDLGLRVPTDVALIGCDGIQDTEYLECPLTTLTQPVQEMCMAAWQFFKDRQGDPARKPQTVILKPRLVIRESTHRKGSA